MRKFAIKSAAPSGEGDVRSSGDDGQGWFRRKWRLIALMAIILMAFVIRFVFAYGISAGDNYALSGGSSASSHLNNIISILSGTFSFTDTAVNYPIGSLNIYPPVMDFIMAGFAGIVSLFGVSTATAAAGTLAWATPIIAALTCYPVYLVAKKMFKDDETIAILSALMYAVFALLIMTSVFSNGTEYAFVGFVFAWMVYFLLKALEAVDATSESGLKGVFADKAILKNTLIAGILFLIIALSWNQFRIVLVCLIFFMVAQALIDRFRSKDLSLTVGVYSVVILLGVLISAPYYIVAGLWSALFSGAFIVGILAVALTLVFAMTAKKSWILMIPSLLIVAAVVLVALFFGANDLFNAVVSGNSYYEGSLMSAIMAGTHTSISALAAYYGWLLVWAPILVFIWMAYRYRKNVDSKKYTFTMLFVLAMFWMSWYSVSNAVIAGIGFAVASGAGIVMVIRWVDVRSYFAGMKGGDAKTKLRKIVKPVPLATVVLLVALIVAPNCIYAVDAATPTNSDGDNSYFGGLGYTISTTESSSMNKLWSEYSDEQKSGALVTWLSYSSDAAYKGGFDSVTDVNGGGSSTMANILLANGSSGATAAMVVRMILANDVADFRTAITNAGLDYNVISGYIDNPKSAVDMITSDIEKYPGLSSNITSENALYVVLVEYITSNLCEPDVDSFYDAVCGSCNSDITYVAVNGSMIPMYYNDSSYFSTLAYFNNYLSDNYGAVTQYYSYNTTTGYATYTSAMYETFLWKSIIGPSASYYGETSSISYLSALALSDGSIKAIPGYGLSNYKVAYWHVMYNADSEATLSSSGWESMDGYEAIALQNEKGGVINYLSGVVLMEYSESATKDFEGTIQYTSASGVAAAAGVEVSVYTVVDYDSTGVAKYVPTCVVKTLENGYYKISVPTDKEYYVVISSGATTTTSGSTIERFSSVDEIDSTYVIGATSFSGTVVTNDVAYTENVYVKIVGQTSGYTSQCNTNTGAFSFSNIVPDVYTVTVFKTDGTTVVSSNITVCTGVNSNARIATTTGTITVTVTDEYGASVNSGSVVATDSSTGFTFTANIEDGKATLNVVPSTYTLSTTDGKMSISTTSVTVASKGSKTATLTAYDTKNISVSGAPSGSMITISALGFSTSSTSTTFAVPVSGASGSDTYSAYAVSGGNVYYGMTTGSSITMSSSTAYTVSGVLKNSSSSTTTGTIAYIMSNGTTFVFTAGSDGSYSAILPAGSYTVYAYNESGSAYLGTQTVSADATNNINMVSSRTITLTLSYKTQLSSSSSTKGLAFADVTFNTTISGTDYSIVLKTSATNLGKAYFYVPTGSEVVITLGAFDNDEFHCAAQSTTIASGSSSTSYSWTLEAKQSTDGDKYAKNVTVSSPYAITMTLYTDSTVKYTFTGSQSVQIGRYTAVIDGSTGYYFNGTVYVYPGQNGALVIDGTSVATVTLNASINDAITVTAVKNSDGKTGNYYQSSSNNLVYYVEKGFDYTFVAKSASTGTETIAYGSVSNANSNVTLDLSNKAESVTIKGYTGVSADGTVTMSYGSTNVDFTVTAGEFKFDVPKGVAMTLSSSVSNTDEITGKVYTYTATRSLTSEAVVDGAIVNMNSVTTSVESDSVLSESGASFSNGVGTVNLTIKNNGSYANTYIVKSGSAWTLEQTYVVTVNAGATGSVAVRGYYDAGTVGAGNSNLSLIVTDVSGNSVGTCILDGTGFTGSSTVTYVDVSGTDGASANAVSTYEYLYAVTVKNNDCMLKLATLSVTISDSKWTYVLSDSNQYQLSTAGTYNVNGYGSTTIYVKVMCSDGSSKTVPNVTISVNVAGATLGTNSSSVSVSGSTATMTLSSTKIDLSASDMNATGDNIYSTPSNVPTSFWIAMALCVVVLIFVAWEGTKRGVFTRKK